MNERGSAVVETVMAAVILMVLVLGAIEVAFALYARNVVAAAAHDGARAAVELGRGRSDAEAVARAVAGRAAGGLLDDLRVTTSVRRLGTSALVRVRVEGRLDAFGPVPLPMTLTSTATVTRATRVR
ncbi:MAG TPA: TadE family protein [Actinomycetota bacterium]